MAVPRILYTSLALFSPSLFLSLSLPILPESPQPTTSARIIDAERVYEFNYSLIALGFPVFHAAFIAGATRIDFFSFPLLFLSPPFFLIARISNQYREINGDLLIEKLTRSLAGWDSERHSSSLIERIIHQISRTRVPFPVFPVVDQTRRREYLVNIWAVSTRALPSDGTPVNEGVPQTGNHRAGAISSEILFIRGEESARWKLVRLGWQ